MVAYISTLLVGAAVGSTLTWLAAYQAVIRPMKRQLARQS